MKIGTHFISERGLSHRRSEGRETRLSKAFVEPVILCSAISKSNLKEVAVKTFFTTEDTRVSQSSQGNPSRVSSGQWG
jgi:hypothetical protein